MHSRLIFRPQIERTETESTQTCYDKAAKGYGPSACVERLPRKASIIQPVPQTDTGIRDEYSKARGLNLSKELGKLAPYPR
jgi:hypothetical protein